ncbi:uncharacterized protein LOC133929178 [Phragmites australis]|uniref:uncharacterized protein LOC133929178 n=1 Tax=Phragmites australis TaxID=29695 RepID=UPI002D78D0A0|nr:uncharacterized protein LOC133929178 [Phragmites australis]
MSLPPDKTPSPDSPAEHKLITAYLRCKLAGKPLPAAAGTIFYDADIYAAEPATLTAGLQPAAARKGEASSWFFFTPVKAKSSSDCRKSRMVGGGVGTWHSEHAPEHVFDVEGNRVGHRQYFSYKRKNGNKSERSGWCMMEYGDDQEDDHEGGGGGDSRLLLCKIYRSRRTDGSASRSSSSGSARKRKDADERVDKASAPVRRRLFASPTTTPPAASQDKICSTKSPPSFLITEPEASLAHCYGTTNLMDGGHNSGFPVCAPGAGVSDSCLRGDTSFLMASGEPPAPEYCYGGTNLMDGCGHVSGMPLCAPGAGTSGSWTGNDNTASWSGEMVFPGGLPTHDDWGIAGSAGASYVRGMPSAPFLPPPASSSWCSGSDLSDGWIRAQMPWTVA